MPLIDVNLIDTPDEIQPVPAGIYECSVADIEAREISTKNGPAMVINTTLAVISDDEHNGRRIRDSIFYESDMGKIKLKNMLKSAGIEVSEEGVDTDDLLQKVVKADVTIRGFMREGQQQHANNVRKYLFDA